MLYFANKYLNLRQSSAGEEEPMEEFRGSPGATEEQYVDSQTVMWVLLGAGLLSLAMFVAAIALTVRKRARFSRGFHVFQWILLALSFFVPGLVIVPFIVALVA